MLARCWYTNSRYKSTVPKNRRRISLAEHGALPVYVVQYPRYHCSRANSKLKEVLACDNSAEKEVTATVQLQGLR